MKDRKTLPLFIASFLLTASITFIRSGYIVPNPSDFAGLVDHAYWISLGLCPFRDFFELSAPLTYQIQGLLLKLAGGNYLVTRLYVSLQGAFLVSLAVLFCLKVLRTGRPFSLLAGMVTLLWSTQLHQGLAWYHSDAMAFAMVAVWMIVVLWERENLWIPGLLGLTCSLVFWSKQDLGAGAILSGGLVVGLRLWKFKPGSHSRLAYSSSFCIGLILPFLIYALYFIHLGALAQAWQSTVLRAIHLYYPRQESFWCGAISSFWSPLSGVGKLLTSIYLVVLWLAIKRFKEFGDQRDLRNTAVVFYGLGIFLSGFVSHRGRYGFESAQTLLGIVFGIGWASLPPGRWWKPGLTAVACALGLRGLHYIPTFHPDENPESFQTLEGEHWGGIKLHQSQKRSLDRIVQYVTQHIPESEAFMVDPESFPVSFATRRKPKYAAATAIYDAMWQSQGRILKELNQEDFKWILFYDRRNTGQVKFDRHIEVDIESCMPSRFKIVSKFDRWIILQKLRERSAQKV